MLNFIDGGFLAIRENNWPNKSYRIYSVDGNSIFLRKKKMLSSRMVSMT